MKTQVENLEELKRKMYLFAMPLLVFALLLNNTLDTSVGTGHYIHITMTVYFSISFLLIYLKRWFRFVELSNLILVSVYHIHKLYQAVQTNLLEDHTTLGDFIIWMPLYVIYIYLTLGRKKGVLFSIGIFLISLWIGFSHVQLYELSSLDSLTQYYMANIVYILAFYYAQFAFGIYTELKSIKTDAYIDPLTEIPNRRKLSIYFDDLLEKAYFKNKGLAVILLDIDNFKFVNDEFGHDVGDQVLKEFAQLINNSITGEEVFGRWGGEEFMIFSQASLKQGKKLAELLRNSIEQHHFTHVDKVTASFGVSSFLEGDTRESMFKRADIALYQSKTNGKNQVTTCEENREYQQC